MLSEARRQNGLEYVVGDATTLPYSDQSWDLVALIATLEFVTDPERVIAEAVRVARQGLILGVLNRSSLLARSYRRSGKPLWNAAHFFSPNELLRCVRKIAGSRFAGVRWRTTLWPAPFCVELAIALGRFYWNGGTIGPKGDEMSDVFSGRILNDQPTEMPWRSFFSF